MPAPTRCWCSTSTPTSPATSAEDFVAELLAQRIGAAGVVTGDDFTFGQRPRRQCRGAARARRASTASSPKRSRRCCSTASAVSSSRIREALAAGDPGTATHLLSRAVRGRRRGRARRRPRPRPRLSDRQPPPRRLSAARLRHLRGARAARRRQRACRRRQPRRPPDLRAARSSCSKRICSTSTRTSTAARSRSRSTPSSGPKRSSTSVDAR